MKLLRKENSKLDEEIKIKARETSRKYREKRLEEKRKFDRNQWKKPKRKYLAAVRIAKSRNIAFTLTLDEYHYIIKQPCYYNCGENASQAGVGIDRLDNSKGYTYENSVSCCGYCNVTKNAHITENEMIEIVNLLKKLRNTDNIWENSLKNQEIGEIRKNKFKALQED